MVYRVEVEGIRYPVQIDTDCGPTAAAAAAAQYVVPVGETRRVRIQNTIYIATRASEHEVDITEE